MRDRKPIILRHLILLALMFLMGISASISASASSYNYTLNLNDSYVSRSIRSNGDAHFYRINLTKPGEVTITYQGWSIYDSRVMLFDANLETQFDDHGVYNSSDTAPNTYSFSHYLEAGSYYVKIVGNGSHTGSYRVKGSFTASGNTEREPNNGFSAAMSLSAGTKIKGLLSKTDRMDFYKINVPKSSEVTITYQGMIRDSYIELWDSGFVQRWSKNVHPGSLSAPKTYTWSDTLSAGVYYLKVTPFYDNEGLYNLSWVTKAAVIKVNEIKMAGTKKLKEGQSAKLSAVAYPWNATNKKLSWSSSNTRIATVSSTGVVTAKKAGTCTIKASATDGSGKSQTYPMTVSPAKILVNNIKMAGSKNLTVGQTTKLSAVAYPWNATNKKLSWSSSDTSVVSVSSNGTVTANGGGMAYIRAAATDGSGKSQTYYITVKPKTVGTPHIYYYDGLKELDVYWDAQSNVTGYQIWLIQGHAGKTINISGTTANYAELSVVRTNSYTVRIRSYRSHNGRKYYGSWSNPTTYTR
ncbi:MAG: Ig-like domain-containing protein [Eubacteriales bacterium]|nr:Ig-like domain-containing protein [Eubacteriales bacterium]